MPAIVAAVLLIVPGRASATHVTDDVRPTPPALTAAATISDSLFMASDDAGVERVLAAALADARADRAATLWLTRRLGELRARHGRAQPAEIALRASETLSLALGDSVTLASALRWQAWVRQQLGDFAGSRRLAARMRTITDRTGDRTHAAWVHMIVGWCDILDGRLPEAIEHYETASREFHALGRVPDEIYALNGLGVALRQSGDYARARACFERTMTVTEGTEYRRAYGHAMLNLAHLEHEIGDPAEAAAIYARVLRLFRERGALNELGEPLFGLASASTEVGRFSEALAALDSVRAVAARQGYREQLGAECAARARVSLAMGRFNEALRLAEEARAMGDSLPVGDRVDAATLRADALDALGRHDEAGRAIAEAERTLGAQAPYDDRLALELRAAERRLESGDARAAEPALLRCAGDAERAQLREIAMRAWLGAARAARARGAESAALERLARASSDWEALRGRPSEPEWREQRTPIARDVVFETLDLMLAAPGTPGPERIAEAYVVLQRFKARTLLERMAGPRPGAPGGEIVAGAATLNELRSGVLRPGEVLLDYFCGARGGFVFAVSRDTCEVARIADSGDLNARVEMFRDLISRPPQRGAAGASLAEAIGLGAHHLGIALLGPVAGTLARAERVIVVPDGAIHFVPFAMIELPGDGPAQPLLDHAVVSSVASATLLGRLRSRSAAPHAAGILAAADSLPGARGETAWLADRLASVDRVSIAGGEGALRPERLSGYGLIHFAGHATTDDQSPWRSGLPFLRMPGGEPGTAADVAGLRLGARLAVLSSCESAGGRTRAGEGVAGLSSAFLAAGVPEVVATQWRVEDRATRRLMTRFYSALLAGEDAGAALRTAQRSLRAEKATSLPYYWAAFTLLGDGRALPELKANSFSARRLTGYALAVAGALFVLALAFRMSRRRKEFTARL